MWCPVHEHLCAIRQAVWVCAFATAGWLKSVYLRDVMSRMADVKAKLMSTFDSILKMDSTKKLTQKLAGKVAEMAQWATDVGNEYSAVLTCVMTTAEGAGLRRMARGLVNRYKDAGVPPPSVLYVDRDCCSRVVMESLFREWPDVAVQLFASTFGTSCDGWRKH